MAGEPVQFTPLCVQMRGGTVRAVGRVLAIALYGVLAISTFGIDVQPLVRLALFVGVTVVFMAGRESFRRWSTRGAVLTLRGDALALHRRGRSIHWTLPPIREGWLEHEQRREAACIRLQSGETLVAWFDQKPQAGLLLTAAGVDANQRVVEWRIATQHRWVKRILLVLSMLVWTGFYLLLAMNLSYSVYGVLLMPALLVAWAMFGVRKVQIGVDGLVLRSIARRRFIDYREIEGLRIVSNGARVELRLARNKSVKLTPGFLDDHSRLVPSAARAMEFAEWIQTRLDARGLTTHVDRLRALLDRRHEPLGEWRRRLRQVALGGYRERAVTPDDFCAVLDSVSATPEQRIGAALALADAGAPDFRERLRVAAERCAAPKLRIALERVSAGQFEDLDPLLDEEPVVETSVKKVPERVH